VGREDHKKLKTIETREGIDRNEIKEEEDEEVEDEGQGEDEDEDEFV